MTTPVTPSIRRKRLLLLLFGVAAVLKIVTSAGTTDFGTDGSYYAEVARHVRDGEGVSTNVSLYHHGYASFPHPSPIYPVWPLVLGTAARIIPLSLAAVWIPTFCYFAAVALCWLWASKLPRTPLFENGIDTADAAALLLAFSSPFFGKTSVPYTEGLAYVLLFLALWRSHFLWQERGWRSGAELGLWIALLLLTRSQLVLFGIAAGVCFAWALLAVKERGRTVAMACTAILVSAAVVLPQYWRLDAITVRPATALLRFEIAQASTVLAPLHVLVSPASHLDAVLGTLRGAVVAFSPIHELSYLRMFGALQYAFLVGVPLAAAALWRGTRRQGLAPVREWMRDPAHLPLVFFVVFALGGIASLHVIHKDFSAEWHFGRRHALTAFFGFFLCWLWLAHSRQSFGRRFASAVLVFSMVAGFSQMARLSQRAVRQHVVKSPRTELLAMLEQERGSSETVVVALAGNEAQRLALVSAGRASFHWVYERTSLEELDTMFGSLGARLLLIDIDRERERTWAFRGDEARFDSLFESAGEVDGYAVWRRRVMAASPPSPGAAPRS